MLGKSTAQTALHFGANDLDGTITEGGELTHSYSVESGGEVVMNAARKHKVAIIPTPRVGLRYVGNVRGRL
jgi:hypothetical protein